MPLWFRSRPVGDITVVECSGRIVEGAESAQLQQHLNDLLPVHPYILLHLGDVDFIDSSGIGLLVRFLARVQNTRGNLKMCAVSPKISQVLRITKLNTIFDAYESEARRCLEEKLVLPAYDWTLKCSHAFNTLDARGAVSVTERVAVIKRVRDLAVRCAQQYLESREALGFPLLQAANG